MIFTAIIVGLIGFLNIIFLVIPVLPATPDAIITGGVWVTNTIGNAIGVLNLIYSRELLIPIVLMLIATITFETTYHTVFWIVRKIPIISVH